MPFYQVMRTPWHPDDIRGLEEQAPAASTYCNTIFDVEITNAYLTIRRWNKFAGLINEAFALVEYEGSFNITISIPAIRSDNYNAVENRLAKLKSVFSSHQPVPACWDWTVVIAFKKFPYWNQLQDYMRSVERAVYGKDFNQVERKAHVRRVSRTKTNS